MTVRVALDTATDWCTVAIGDEHDILAAATVGHRRHAGALMSVIESCLSWVDLDLDAVTEIVAADGPGSFTGLRIGWATIQGLVMGRPIPVRTAPSMLAAAWGAVVASEGPRGPVAVLYDALRGQVYGAVYELTGSNVTVHTAPHLTTVEELQRLAPRPSLVVGDGALVHAAQVSAWTGRSPVAPWLGPRAESLVALAQIDGATRLVSDVAAFEPDYGRRAEAQVRWEREHGQALPDPSRPA